MVRRKRKRQSCVLSEYSYGTSKDKGYGYGVLLALLEGNESQIDYCHLL